MKKRENQDQAVNALSLSRIYLVISNFLVSWTNILIPWQATKANNYSVSRYLEQFSDPFETSRYQVSSANT